jgi:hypothetical protein
MKRLIVACVLAMMPLSALADDAKPACSTALNAALPETWKVWTTPETLPAAATPATQPEILLGHAYMAQLKPTASVSYAVQPKKTTDGTFGGLLMLTIDKAAVYTIALDQAAWIDVVRDGKGLKPSGHGHGPDCTTIRKMADFKLDPGHYTLQISNAPKDTVLIGVVAKP